MQSTARAPPAVPTSPYIQHHPQELPSSCDQSLLSYDHAIALSPSLDETPAACPSTTPQTERRGGGTCMSEEVRVGVNGSMDTTEMYTRASSMVPEEMIPALARSGATFGPPSDSADRPRRNQQEPPGGRGRGLDADFTTTSHQDDINYRLLQQQLFLQREQEVSWLRSKVDELNKKVAEKDMEIIELNKKLQEERMQRAALLGDFWRNRQPPASPDFVATPTGQTWNTKWPQGEISLLRAQVEALSKEIHNSRKETMQNTLPNETTLKQQPEEWPGRQTLSQTTTEDTVSPMSPTPVSSCSSTSSSVVSVTPSRPHSKKEAPVPTAPMATPKTPPGLLSYSATTSSPCVVVSTSNTNAAGDPSLSMTAPPSPPVFPTDEESEVLTVAGGPSKNEQVKYFISPDKDGPLKGWYCQMDKKRPSSPPFITREGDNIEREKKTSDGKKKSTPPAATHITTEQQGISPFPEDSNKMPDSSGDKKKVPGSSPISVVSIKKTDSNDKKDIVINQYVGANESTKRPSLSEAMQEVSELTMPSLDHGKYDSKGQPAVIKSTYAPPAALGQHVVKLAKVQEELAPAKGGHGQTSDGDNSDDEDDSKGQPVLIKSNYTPPAALQYNDTATKPAKGEGELAPSQGHDQASDDDNSFLGGQSLDSSTFGDNRVRVVNKNLSDPYGYMGVYTGLILRSTGMPHGSGRMVYANGRTYEGAWHFGRWHGYGRACFTNGDCYEGEYERDRRQGYGVYRWGDGRVYSGSFRNDKRNGKGTYRWPDGCVYEGDFVNGRREGHGSYKFEDGSTYVGGWKNGLHYGFGTCTWANGRQYRGGWKNGKSHGRGVETYSDGRVRHDGLWIDDAPAGAGPSGSEETKTEDVYDSQTTDYLGNTGV